MPLVRFSKYSVYGNILIFIDEVSKRQLSEPEKSAFARAAINEHLGIGADNLIMLQTYSPELMKEIGDNHKYWKTFPHLNAKSKPDYVFRMFEPDGREALCCGNGLVCTAHHLYAHYGIKAARILTEIPSSNPKVRQTVTTDSGSRYQVNMGCPMPIPEDLINKDMITNSKDVLGFIKNLPIAIQWMKTDGNCTEFYMQISGFVTYIGEPHLVVFEQQNSSLSDDLSTILHLMFSDNAYLGSSEKDYGNYLADSIGIFHKIGLDINHTKSRFFPHGININFARVLSNEGVIECRSFERGINKETLACGTGALAVAIAAHQLGLVKPDSIEIIPRRARWYDCFKDAQLRTIRSASGEWWLETKPQCIFSGTIDFPL